MAKKSKPIGVGEIVHVKLAGGGVGDTKYEVTAMGTHSCRIREAGIAPNGKPYAEYLFDASLLVRS
jgi:hypothetical protein